MNTFSHDLRCVHHFNADSANSSYLWESYCNKINQAAQRYSRAHSSVFIALALRFAAISYFALMRSTEAIGEECSSVAFVVRSFFLKVVSYVYRFTALVMTRSPIYDFNYAPLKEIVLIACVEGLKSGLVGIQLWQQVYVSGCYGWFNTCCMLYREGTTGGGVIYTYMYMYMCCRGGHMYKELPVGKFNFLTERSGDWIIFCTIASPQTDAHPCDLSVRSRAGWDGCTYYMYCVHISCACVLDTPNRDVCTYT